ncbi:hypothetical protein BC835DRAFT_1333537 [Cytidiella melzeri]|nr:hypothetical protein BC835DRAFT_1333537 [Cytidiella melzeri]
MCRSLPSHRNLLATSLILFVVGGVIFRWVASIYVNWYDAFRLSGFRSYCRLRRKVYGRGEVCWGCFHVFSCVSWGVTCLVGFVRLSCRTAQFFLGGP